MMNQARRDIQLPLRILARIQQHTSKDPIKIRTLAEEFGISERSVKGHIFELVDAGHKIGSRKTEPMGVFLASHPSEVYETAKRIHDEGIKFLLRAKKLMDWGGVEPTIFEQVPVEESSLYEFNSQGY